MGKAHVYIKPFAVDDGTSYASSWTEVTKDVQNLGDLEQILDNTEYDVGIFRSSNVDVMLRNESGYYSDVGELNTLFRFSRGNSKVQITWEPGNHALYAGFFTAGAPDAIVSEEIFIFEGLLNDITTTSDIASFSVKFQILGYESALDTMLIPTITIGQTLATAIYSCLNQAPFNAYVSVLPGNITVSNAITIDDASKFNNDSALSALQLLLPAANAVMFVQNNIVYVTTRAASALTPYTFYGPASESGIENIISIQSFRTGLNRVTNVWAWDSTTPPLITATEPTSKATYGPILKKIKFDFITDPASRLTIVTSFKDEFGTPKKEFEIRSVLDVWRLSYFLLDRINIDYPTLALSQSSQNVAIYGRGIYGTDYYPVNLFVLTLDTTQIFKIIGRKISFADETMTFIVRAV